MLTSRTPPPSPVFHAVKEEPLHLARDIPGSVFGDEFDLEILSEQHALKSTPGYHTPIRNGAHFQLRLSNKLDVACNARVFVDEQQTNFVRIGPSGSVVLERPECIEKKFTFFRIDTFDIMHHLKGDQANGMIRVEFTPALKEDPVETKEGFALSDISLSDLGFASGDEDIEGDYNSLDQGPVYRSLFSEGRTSLTGHSSQTFSIASVLRMSSRVTQLQLRLVCYKAAPRPSIPESGVVHLLSSPFPAPI